jgi:hypothetical protein
VFSIEQVVELRKRTENLPDDYWVVLVGDMITEEALPTYMAMLNTLDGVRDETGAANTPWGRCITALLPRECCVHIFCSSADRVTLLQTGSLSFVRPVEN